MDRFLTDFHNHTSLSRCALKEMTHEAVVRRFEACGLFIAGVSDHYYTDGLARERCRATREALTALASPVDVRVGVELDLYYPGKAAAGPGELDFYDYVLVSCTHYQNTSLVALPLSMEYPAVAQNLVDFMTYAASLPFADVIAHPFHATGLERCRPDFDAAEAIRLIPNECFTRIARDMAENGVAIELNPVLQEEGYAREMRRFYAVCKKEGVQFALGSDAHWLSGIHEIALVRGYIDSLGITGDDLWIPGED